VNTLQPWRKAPVQRHPGADGAGDAATGGSASGAARAVTALDRSRIERALARRARYRYVQPRVEPEGAGWKIVSPNCSRRIDAGGGEIHIAWFEPTGPGRWAVHSRDHVHRAWRLEAVAMTLPQALAQVCTDALGRYWP
jgi:hypothetical protein